MNSLYEVSVLVVTYNSNEEKLIATLKSIVHQENCNFEVVIADDGSEFFDSEMIKHLFDDYNFVDFKIVKNRENQGTVKNVYTGLKECKGTYVKLISPGDLLCDYDVLYKWYSFMEENNSLCSFCDSTYYNIKDEKFVLLKMYGTPQEIISYTKKRKKRCAKNYILFKDVVLGASTLCKKEILEKYIKQIVDKVIYADDNVYRLMVFDGIAIDYYPGNALLYEWGSGISTSANDMWIEKIRRDWNVTTEIMIQNKKDRFKIKKKLVLFEKKIPLFKKVDLNICDRVFLFLYEPDYIFFKVLLKISKRLTREDINYDFIKVVGLII